VPVLVKQVIERDGDEVGHGGQLYEASFTHLRQMTESVTGTGPPDLANHQVSKRPLARSEET